MDEKLNRDTAPGQEGPPPWVDVDVDHAEDEEPISLRLPREHRHHWVGWGNRPRVCWVCPDTGRERVGMEIARGDAGITVVDEHGHRIRLRHGDYRLRRAGAPRPSTVRMAKAQAWDRLERMLKGYPPPKPGSRWITVRPGGPGTKGTPILVEPTGEKGAGGKGVFRVVGGAGGSMHHLRLELDRTPTEADKAKWKQRAEDNRKAKTKRRAEALEKLTPEQKEDSRQARVGLRNERVKLEQQLVERARAVVGGIVPDLSDEDLEGLSPAARMAAQGRRRQQQLKQAQARIKEIQAELAGKDDGAEEARRAIEEAVLRADPETLEEARELAQEAIDEREIAAAERKEELAKPRKVVDRQARAIEAVEERLDEIEDLAPLYDQAERVGGALGASIKDQVDTFATAHKLHRLRKGDELEAEEVDDLANRADREGWAVSGDDLRSWSSMEEAEQQEIEGLVRAEVARQARKAEHLDRRNRRIEKIEEEKGTADAFEVLAEIKLQEQITQDAKQAAKLGLGADGIPLNDVEIPELLDVLRTSASLEAVRAEYRAIEKEIEQGKYDESRRAFKLWEAPTDAEALEAAIERGATDLRDGLTRQLTGMADPRSADHVEAVVAAHHAAFAEVALDLTEQQYLDRSVVEAVGAKNAAILMRFAMESDGLDPAALRTALEEEHIARVDRLTAKALERVEAVVPDLFAEVSTTGELDAAMKQIDVARYDMQEAQRVVGAALGQLEATATLAQTFREPGLGDVLSVPFDARDQALVSLHAAGLRPSDYRILEAADGQPPRIEIPKRSWEKMIQRAPAEEVERRRTIRAIKSGEHDEEGWLPDGMVSRTPGQLRGPEAQPARYAEPLVLPPSPEGYADTVAEHVAARLAEGTPADVIQRDLLDPSVRGAVGDVEAYDRAVRDAIPTMAYERLLPKWTTPEGLTLEQQPDGSLQAFDKDGQALDLTTQDPDEARRELAARSTWTRAVEAIDRETFDAEQGSGSVQARPRSAEELAPLLEERVSSWAKARGMEAVGVEAQSIDLGDKRTQEALHQALAKVPTGAAAFVPPAELTHEDRRALRDYFHERQGIDPKDRYNRAEYEAQLAEFGPEPPKERPEGAMGLFGAAYSDPVNPAWKEWKARTDELRKRHPAFALEAELAANPEPTVTEQEWATMSERDREVWTRNRERWESRVEELRAKHGKGRTAWAQYVEDMGGRESAFGALQAELRGRVIDEFASAAGRQGVALRRGVAPIPSAESHLLATASEQELQELRERRRTSYAQLRERDTGGRFAAERERLQAKFERDQAEARAAQQQQVGMFGVTRSQAEVADQAALYSPAAPEVKARAGERLTVGRRVEELIGGVIKGAARPFGGKRVDLFPGASMDGARIAQQRAVKQARANNWTIGLFHGTGTGKTAEMIGIGTQAITDGAATRAIIATPVAVAEQFGQEALAFTEPGKYKIEVSTGTSHEQRLAMLRGDSTIPGFAVFTHEALRDTWSRMVADHAFAGDVGAMTERAREMSRQDLAELTAKALEANGIDGKFLPMIDEAHRATAREGVQASLLSIALRALGDNAMGRVAATATANKNDASEIESMFSLLDPKLDGEAFRRNLSTDPEHNADYLRRHYAHLYSTAKIPPQGVTKSDLDNPEVGEAGLRSGAGLQLSTWQQEQADRIGKAYEALRTSRRRGRVDVEAARTLDPDAFDGASPEDAEKIAQRIASTAAMARDRAYDRTLRRAPYEHNPQMQRVVEVARAQLKRTRREKAPDGSTREAEGRRGVLFADRLTTVRATAQALEEHGGLRVAVYHGGLSHDERSAIIQRAKAGELDAIVATAAAEAGLNLHMFQYTANVDVPITEKSNTQRQGRVYRQKQRDDTEAFQFYYDHEFDERARRRLRTKAGLQSVFGDPHDHLDETGVLARYNDHLRAKHATRDGWAA